MGEGAPAVAVAERPDTRHRGLQLIVDLDIAALVGLHPGMVEPEIAGIGHASHRHQDMAGKDRGRALGAVEPHFDPVAFGRKADAFGVGADGDILMLQHVAQDLRDRLVLARNQAVPLLDDRDARSEAAIGLPEFEPDIAAADHHEMLGQIGEIEQRTVGEQPHVARARHVGDQRAAADIDEDIVGEEKLVADAHALGPFEPRMAEDERAPGQPAQPMLAIGPRIDRDLLRAGVDAGHVDAHRTGRHAEVGAAAREVGSIGRCDHRLGRLAAGVDACAAD